MKKFIITILSKIIYKFKLKSNNKSKKTSSTFLFHETNPLDLADKDLIDNDNISNRDRKRILQTTKKIVWIILSFSVIWITWSYILATYAMIVYGNTEVGENLSIQVCVTILGTILGYCIKSYFETNAEKKNEQDLLFKQIEMGKVINTDEEAVG